jgi:methionyl-tRNA formyltransferase
MNGEVIKVWSAHVGEGRPGPSCSIGEIVSLSPAGIEVAAIESIVVIGELQRPGGKRLSSADFLRGNPWQLGQALN